MASFLDASHIANCSLESLDKSVKEKVNVPVGIESFALLSEFISDKYALSNSRKIPGYVSLSIL